VASFDITSGGSDGPGSCEGERELEVEAWSSPTGAENVKRWCKSMTENRCDERDKLGDTDLSEVGSGELTSGNVGNPRSSMEGDVSVLRRYGREEDCAVEIARLGGRSMTGEDGRASAGEGSEGVTEARSTLLRLNS
jgi:hypothetical protein